MDFGKQRLLLVELSALVALDEEALINLYLAISSINKTTYFHGWVSTKLRGRCTHAQPALVQERDLLLAEPSR